MGPIMTGYGQGFAGFRFSVAGVTLGRDRGSVRPILVRPFHPKKPMFASVLRAIARRVLKPDWQILAAQLRVEYERARVTQSSIPLIAQQLLVSGEDHRHGNHHGYDLIAITRAVWRRISRRTHEGASTIEQQIIRVLTGRYERTMARKVREILLATLVTTVVPKHSLPAIYLRVGYYGWRMNGWVAACSRLHLSPTALGLQAAALLVARLKYPQPRNSPQHRARQIECRAHHLMTLRAKHLHDGTYAYLTKPAVASAVLSRAPYERPLGVIPESAPTL